MRPEVTLLLSAGGVDESAGYPGSVQLLPSRALIPPRKAGLAEHDENYGTKSSNPLPSSDERCRTDKLDGVIKHRSSRETTTVGRVASLDGRLFFGGTDGSNPVPSSGESSKQMATFFREVTDAGPSTTRRSGIGPIGAMKPAGTRCERARRVPHQESCKRPRRRP